MQPPEPTLLLASEHPEKGSFHLARVSDRVVAATTAGDGPSRNPKRAPNEDSVAVCPLADGVAALVADAHYGPSAGEVAARAFAAAVRRSPPASARALGRVAIALDAAVIAERKNDDASETAALLATLRGATLTWASVGDCRLLRWSRAGGLGALNGEGSAFVGGRIFELFRERLIALEPPLGETGEATLAPGDVVLLASDGLDEEVSGLAPERIAAILAEPVALEARVGKIMAEGGRAASGGGRDNLSLVAFEVG